jgi:hypothetical protein
MKKLMVAGCSFSATTNPADGTSWSEVLAGKLGWELTNLARQGCSNGGVRIQIEEIRRQRPAFAIITPTFWDRTEIPVKSAPYKWDSQATGGWNPKIQEHLQDRTIKNGYRREDGINNINYGKNNYNMICETIYTLAENFDNQYRKGLLPKETVQAVRYYIDQMYDSAWKKQQDEWIIVEGILQLHLDGIAFIVSPVLLWPFDPHNQSQWRSILPSIIPDRCIMQESMESVLSVSGTYSVDVKNDPGYHTNHQGQQVIADNWYRRIVQEHGIS